MKQLLSIILSMALLFSITYAEHYDDSNITEVLIERMQELDVEHLLMIKEEAERLIAIKQKENGQDPGYLGVWKEKYFVDEFNDPTDEKYVLGLFKGTFSNSVANNSELLVKMIISMNNGKPCIGIELYEYGSYLVKNTGSGKAEYIFSMKDENGEVYTFCYSMWSSRMFFENKGISKWVADEQIIIDLLKSNKTLKFSISDNNSYSRSTYRFTIEDSTGLENALKWLAE